MANTREIIQNAVYTLICKQPVDEVSVNDIIQEAGISRPTFYRYYTDKFDATNSIYDQHISKIREDYLRDNDFEQLMCSFYRIFYDHRAFYLNLLTNIHMQNSFFSYWEKMNLEQAFAEINKKKRSSEIKVAVALYAHGSMFVSWDLIRGKIDLTPEETAHYVVQDLPPVLKEYYQL